MSRSDFDLEDVTRRFQEVSDRLKRGGAPNVDIDNSPNELDRAAAVRLEQIEEQGRPADNLWSRTATTAGTGVTYAADDTYRLPFIGRSLTIFLPDTYGAILQIAARGGPNPEWRDEMRLQGPIALSIPILTESIRVRALVPATAQAAYTLIVTDTREPIGVAVIDDTGAAAEIASTAAEEATLVSVLAATDTTNELLREHATLSRRILLALELLIDEHIAGSDAEQVEAS